MWYRIIWEIYYTQRIIIFEVYDKKIILKFCILICSIISIFTILFLGNINVYAYYSDVLEDVAYEKKYQYQPSINDNFDNDKIIVTIKEVLFMLFRLSSTTKRLWSVWNRRSIRPFTCGIEEVVKEIPKRWHIKPYWVKVFLSWEDLPCFW